MKSNVKNNTFITGVAAALITMSVSLHGLNFIREKEGGMHLTPYRDPVGIPTVCVGSTTNVVMGKQVTYEECLERYSKDIVVAENAIKNNVKQNLSQGAFDALASFIFNVGTGNFERSTLLRKINEGDCYGATSQFHRWVYATDRKGNMVVLPGLVTRRGQEAEMFLTTCTGGFK